MVDPQVADLCSGGASAAEDWSRWAVLVWLRVTCVCTVPKRASNKGHISFHDRPPQSRISCYEDIASSSVPAPVCWPCLCVCLLCWRCAGAAESCVRRSVLSSTIGSVGRKVQR